MLKQQRYHETRGELLKNSYKIHLIIIKNNKCHCQSITRFISKMINFLIDCTNIIKNFLLYRFFIKILNDFYMLANNYMNKISNRLCNKEITYKNNNNNDKNNNINKNNNKSLLYKLFH